MSLRTFVLTNLGLFAELCCALIGAGAGWISAVGHRAAKRVEETESSHAIVTEAVFSP